MLQSAIKNNANNSSYPSIAASPIAPTPAPSNVTSTTAGILQNQPKESKPIAVRIINKIDQFERKYIDKCPLLSPLYLFQIKIDLWVFKINTMIEKAREEALIKNKPFLDDKINRLLDCEVKGLIPKLAAFFARLPFKIARNMLRCLKTIILGIGYTAVHPVKAVMKLTKLIIILLNEMSKPETWSKMGAGMIGSSLGQAAIGSPLSIIMAIIGASAVAAGLSLGALKASIEAFMVHKDQGTKVALAEARKAVVENLKKQVEMMPEAFCTGFLMGLMVGGVQKAIRDREVAEAQRQVDAKLARDKATAIRLLRKGKQVELNADYAAKLEAASKRAAHLFTNKQAANEYFTAWAKEYAKNNGYPEPDKIAIRGDEIVLGWNEKSKMCSVVRKTWGPQQECRGLSYNSRGAPVQANHQNVMLYFKPNQQGEIVLVNRLDWTHGQSLPVSPAGTKTYSAGTGLIDHPYHHELAFPQSQDAVEVLSKQLDEVMKPTYVAKPIPVDSISPAPLFAVHNQYSIHDEKVATIQRMAEADRLKKAEDRRKKAEAEVEKDQERFNHEKAAVEIEFSKKFEDFEANKQKLIEEYIHEYLEKYAGLLPPQLVEILDDNSIVLHWDPDMIDYTLVEKVNTNLKEGVEFKVSGTKLHLSLDGRRTTSILGHYNVHPWFDASRCIFTNFPKDWIGGLSTKNWVRRHITINGVKPGDHHKVNPYKKLLLEKEAALQRIRPVTTIEQELQAE